MLVPTLRQSRLRQGTHTTSGSEIFVAECQPWWPEGTHGNQTTFSNGLISTFPHFEQVTEAVFLSFLTSQAGIIHAVMRHGAKVHILHLVHSEHSGQEPLLLIVPPTGDEVLEDSVLHLCSLHLLNLNPSPWVLFFAFCSSELIWKPWVFYILWLSTRVMVLTQPWVMLRGHGTGF